MSEISIDREEGTTQTVDTADTLRSRIYSRYYDCIIHAVIIINNKPLPFGQNGRRCGRDQYTVKWGNVSRTKQLQRVKRKLIEFCTANAPERNCANALTPRDSS